MAIGWAQEIHDHPHYAASSRIFSALVVSGLATILQARPVGPIGAGYPLYMGTSGAFIGVSTEAVAAGGLSLLATLVVVSGACSF